MYRFGRFTLHILEVWALEQTDPQSFHTFAKLCVGSMESDCPLLLLPLPAIPESCILVLEESLLVLSAESAHDGHILGSCSLGDLQGWSSGTLVAGMDALAPSSSSDVHQPQSLYLSADKGKLYRAHLLLHSRGSRSPGGKSPFTLQWTFLSDIRPADSTLLILRSDPRRGDLLAIAGDRCDGRVYHVSVDGRRISRRAILPNLAPILDGVVHEANYGDGQDVIYCCSGSGPYGFILEARRGLALEHHAMDDQIGHVKSMWSLPSKDSQGHPPMLILSYWGQTRFFQLDGESFYLLLAHPNPLV